MDLIKKYGNDEFLLGKIAGMNLLSTHPVFKVGQIIEFNGGYYNDIRFKSKITGFDKDGGIYVVWDCYWFPIHNDEIRKIEVTL